MNAVPPKHMLTFTRNFCSKPFAKIARHDDTERMSDDSVTTGLETPEPTSGGSGKWIDVPRQDSQKRCGVCDPPKRTFYWTWEKDEKGKPRIVCGDCLNARTARAIAAPVEAQNGGRKPGRKSGSYIAPSKRIAIITARARGDSKASISREVHSSRDTVAKVLNEADFDKRVEEGRFKVIDLVEDAIAGIKLACAKGDGSTAIRLLEGVNVLGPKANGKRGQDPNLFVAIQNLMLGTATPQTASPPAISAEVVSVSSSPSSSQP